MATLGKKAQIMNPTISEDYQDVRSVDLEYLGLDTLIEQLSGIRAEMDELEVNAFGHLWQLHNAHAESARNLLHYLALRRHDLRQMQETLAANGLSSLGRAESHVKANVEAIENILRRLSNNHHQEANPQTTRSTGYAQGVALLDAHSEALLGPKPAKRVVRIMVTMPGEAANDYEYVRELLINGMDCLRINCAYDDEAAWEKMITHARRAAKETGKSCRVLMDLAGPKLRTGPIAAGPELVKWRPYRDVYGNVKSPARIWLTASENQVPPPMPGDACLPVPGEWLKQLKAGDVIKFFDARGASRSLTVIGPMGYGWWAECSQTVYIESKTTLQLTRQDHRHCLPLCCEAGKLPAIDQWIYLDQGDTLLLTRSAAPGELADYDDDGKLRSLPRIGVTLPEIFDDVRAGEKIWFDDGAIGGVIESVDADEIKIKITHTKPGGAKLRADKGINLPDTNLQLPALTEKDLQDLAFIAKHADLVGYSFVKNADDVKLLQTHLLKLGGEHLGIILKVETRRAVEELATLLLAVMRSPCAGVMIARGDLAVECGWERMAEVQEEILWICEAAHMPVIWATQVLESLAKKGIPSRAEITDAAMGERAECVMLNKGPYIMEAVRVLDNILERMQAHHKKKRSMLRHLRLADHLAIR